MKKVAIYCRVSTEEQAKNKEGSIASQVQRLEMKVNEKNRYENNKWGKIIDIYKDEACSGKNIDRPEFQRMLADVQSKRINTILVTELSRLSRSVTDFLNFVKELEDRNCDFICLQYDFDTTSPAGKVFMTIIMALAQFERELTAERIKNNFYARALRGLSNGGVPFLGYDKDPLNPGKLIVNLKEASIVKEVFNLYLAGENFAEVEKNLNQRGLRNKSWISKAKKSCGGQKFNTDAIWRILTNYAYIGKREINKSNKNLNQDSLKPEERYTIVDASWDAIIDTNTFRKVQEKRYMNKKIKYAPNFDFAYSGITTCDECGGSLCGKSGSGRGNKKYFYYGHAKKTDCRVKQYNAEAFEKLIRKQMFSLINNEAMNKQFVEALTEQTKDQSSVSQTLLESYQKKIEKLKSENERLTKLLTKDLLAEQLDSLLFQIKSNKDHLSQLEAAKQKIEAKSLKEITSRNIDADFILSGIKKLRQDNFRKAKISKKRSIVQEVIKAIYVHPENVIQVDFWTNKEQTTRNASHQPGTVLPFRKLAKPLEASFHQNHYKKDRFSEIKKAVGFGTYVLHHNDPQVGQGSYKNNGGHCRNQFEPFLR